MNNNLATNTLSLPIVQHSVVRPNSFYCPPPGLIHSSCHNTNNRNEHVQKQVTFKVEAQETKIQEKQKERSSYFNHKNKRGVGFGVAVAALASFGSFFFSKKSKEGGKKGEEKLKTPRNSVPSTPCKKVETPKKSVPVTPLSSSRKSKTGLKISIPNTPTSRCSTPRVLSNNTEVVNWCGDGKCDGKCENKEWVNEIPEEQEEEDKEKSISKKSEQEEAQEEDEPSSPVNYCGIDHCAGECEASRNYKEDPEDQDEQEQDVSEQEDSSTSSEEPEVPAPTFSSESEEEEEEEEEEEKFIINSRNSTNKTVTFSDSEEEEEENETPAQEEEEEEENNILIKEFSGNTQNGNVKLSYRESGTSSSSSETIILLHDNLRSSETFEVLMKELKLASYHVIAPDLRGFGQSAKLMDFKNNYQHDYTLETFSQDIHELLDSLSLFTSTSKRVILWGHGMGGMVAIQFAHDYPTLVSKLILQSSTAKMLNTQLPTQYEGGLKEWEYNQLKSKLQKLGLPRFVEYTTSNDLNDAALQEDIKSVLEFLYPIGLQTQATIVEQIMNNWISFDLRDYLSSMKVPTLIIVGSLDKMMAGSEYLHEQLSNSFYECIKGGGHDLHLTFYKLLLKKVLKFLSH